jgi:hypothetical protein
LQSDDGMDEMVVACEGDMLPDGFMDGDVEAPVGRSVVASIGDSVWGAGEPGDGAIGVCVGGAIGASVGGAIGASVGGAIGASVGGSVLSSLYRTETSANPDRGGILVPFVADAGENPAKVHWAVCCAATTRRSSTTRSE